MNISEIKRTHTTIALVGFAATCGSGMMIIWQFQPHLFFTLDITRFILWATALPLPSLFVTYGIGQDLVETEGDHAAFQTFAASAVFTAISVTFSCLVCRMLNLSLGHFVTLMALLQTGLAIGAIHDKKTRRRIAKKKAANVDKTAEVIPAQATD